MNDPSDFSQDENQIQSPSKDEQLESPMTSSYSEIASTSNRPLDLPSFKNKNTVPLDKDGHVHYDGDMTHYVADNLEFKIKLSSPVGKSPINSRSGTPSGHRLYRQLLAPQIGQIDVTVLNDLEHEAQRIAQSVDHLIENLSAILHSNSAITVDNIEIHKNAVGKTCDVMDANIKSMYTILAKGEELSNAMRPIYAQAARVAEIHHLVNALDKSI